LAIALPGAGPGVGPAAGQGLNLPGGNSSAPIEITADEGIEWQQKAQAYIARGNAKVVQGDSQVFADTLTAYYQGGGEGQRTHIVRIDAVGAVRLVSPTGTATGTQAIYDVDKGVLVLTGTPRLVTATDRISARDSLEYWRDRAIVVARGAAMAVREDKRLSADILVGYLKRDAQGGEKIDRIDAFDNVAIITPTDIVRGNQGVYNVETGIATLTGSVKITRGDNQLNGDRAEVDLNSGQSRLLSGPGGPVRGVFVPDKGQTRPAGPAAPGKQP